MDLFLTACPPCPLILCYQLQSINRHAGLLKTYGQICLAQGCSTQMEPPGSRHFAMG